MSVNPTRKWSDNWPKEQWQLAHTLMAEAKKSGALIRMPCQVCGAELLRTRQAGGGQMSSGAGPPGRENATPRLDTEAARKVNDDRQHIGSPPETWQDRYLPDAAGIPAPLRGASAG